MLPPSPSLALSIADVAALSIADIAAAVYVREYYHVADVHEVYSGAFELRLRLIVLADVVVRAQRRLLLLFLIFIIWVFSHVLLDPGLHVSSVSWNFTTEQNSLSWNFQKVYGG